MTYPEDILRGIRDGESFLREVVVDLKGEVVEAVVELIGVSADFEIGDSCIEVVEPVFSRPGSCEGYEEIALQEGVTNADGTDVCHDISLERNRPMVEGRSVPPGILGPGCWRFEMIDTRREHGCPTDD